MFDIISKFLTDLISNILGEIFSGMSMTIGEMFHTSYFLEEYPNLPDTPLNLAAVSAGYKVLYVFLLSLLALKLIWKGFNVYILARNGDADVSPTTMVIGAAKALAVAVAFPILYRYMVDIMLKLTLDVVNAMGAGGFGADSIYEYLSIGIVNSVVSPLVIALYVIGFVILFFGIIKRGVELLILRLGVPIAVIGFVDSDDGVWKSYVQLFFRQAASTMIQDFCIILGLMMMLQANGSIAALLVAIMIQFTAFSAPKLLSQITAPSGSSGQGTMMVLSNAARLLVK